MQLVDVIRDCNKHTLCLYIILPPVQVLPEPHILFDDGKSPFCLYAAVHPELCTVITQNAFKILNSPFMVISGADQLLFAVPTSRHYATLVDREEVIAHI